MNRTIIFAIAVGSFFAASAPAQQVRGKFNPESAYNTNVQLALGRLTAEIQGMVRAIEKTPPLVQRDLLPRAELALKQIDALAEVAERNPNRDRIRREYGPVETSVNDLIRSARKHALANSNLIGHTAIIAAVNIQLEIAITGGRPAGEERRELAKHIARQLEAQSQMLLEIARTELPPDRTSAPIERVLKNFEKTAGRLADALAASANWGGVKPQFAELGPAWSEAVRVLRAIPPTGTERTRIQASQVDRLYRNLVQLFDPDADPDAGFELLLPHKDRALIVMGSGPGGPPIVRLFQNRTGHGATDFMPYHASFRGGVRVAVADVTGDGIADIITAPGPGMPPLIRVFDGRDLSLINEFLAYDRTFTGGLFLAVGDINKDGRIDLVTGADSNGGPHVRIFDGKTGRLVQETFAYDRDFLGGVRVALGDVTGNGVLDVVTAPGPGMPPLIKIFDARTLRPKGEFYAYDPKMLGGVWVAAADMNRNGRAEIVTGADNAGPHVRVFHGLKGKLLSEFFAYDPSSTAGARVAVQDVNRDGFLDIVTVPGPGVPAQVRVFDGSRKFTLMDEFLAFPPAFRGGAFISTR